MLLFLLKVFSKTIVKNNTTDNDLYHKRCLGKEITKRVSLHFQSILTSI